MQTITRNGTNVSLYLFDDAEVVDATTDATYVGNPVYLIIADCTTENSTLYTGVSNPDAWEGWKYLYTPENGWELNPNRIPPEISG